MTLERSLLLRAGDVWRDAVTGQGATFVEELGRRFRHDGDLVGEWYPLGPERAAVLDPERSFGQPVDPKSGVRCDALAQALKIEGDEQMVADLYGVTLDAVRDADGLRLAGYIR